MQDGSPVEIRSNCAPEAVGYCLRFMYTGREYLSQTSDNGWNLTVIRDRNLR